MAVELIRQVWCDIHLKRDKQKLEATEAYATVLLDGKFVQVDACDNCVRDGLLYDDIRSYGYEVEPLRANAERMSEKIRDKPAPRGGARKLVECSQCHKQVTEGSGWSLHNMAHQRHGEPSGKPLMVVD